ncbi:MAG: succinate dehydrogenase/fumarate reductase iron-sulfur subunit [Alphaproteobacteria bacterium]|nr:succinate dehydrogenase/fumarate reductase iron-sulfur subunit [Alphaproteobacteria bacterium]MDD9919609.1 succinate dehydrogenase/fumarate reductase iron-sulfur subunit [Alphaproteobacteria bacterium]
MAETKKKTTAKAPAKKTAAKKTVTKKTPAAKKPATKAAAAKKPTATKKATATKKPATKAVAKKTAAKKAPAKKTTAKKAAPKKANPAVSSRKPMRQTVTFRVKRGTVIGERLQQKDQDYKVSYDGAMTVLQGLEVIKGDMDGTLTFRRSCRASICGSCGMFIANRSRLACKTKIKDLVEGNAEKNIAPVKDGIITIEPQKNQPVLKDLVVDIEPFYNKVKDIIPYVQEGAESEKSVDKDSFSQVNMVSNCIMCGSCVSDCTAMAVNPDFIGPAALAKAYRFVADPREGSKTERLKELSEKNGIWDCVRCGMCIDACPKDVAPMQAIVKLRSKAIDAGITNHAGARHSMSMKKDIATWGVLNEPFMLLKTLRFGIFSQIGNALNLFKKGKIPNPLPFDHKATKLNEVKAIFAELEKNPIDVDTKAEDSGPGAG